MNKLHAILILGLMTFFMISCDSNECTADDWSGIWSGMLVDFDGVDQSTVVTIKATSDNMITFVQDGEDYGSITISGCSFSESQSQSTILGDITVALDAELSGDIINLSIDIVAFGENISQKTVLSRQ